jgi:transcriptional regulator of met regulon
VLVGAHQQAAARKRRGLTDRTIGNTTHDTTRTQRTIRHAHNARHDTRHERESENVLHAVRGTAASTYGSSSSR